MKSTTLVLCLINIALLSGCGTMTGIPSHGGGKRFAIEQQLIAQSARAAIKGLDVESLKGRKVVLRMSSIGDQGAGNLSGGRYSIEALLRGGYVNTPDTQTRNTLPTVNTTATTTSGGLTSTTVAQNVLNAPISSVTNSEGSDSSVNGGIRVGGLGEYGNSSLITNPMDVTYLLNLIQTFFYLKGIEIVDPSSADVAVFITADVFGTIRSREDLHILNKEKLVAQTTLELIAVDLRTRKLISKPSTSSYESSYTEQYALWAGPLKKSITVDKAKPLLVDFADVTSDTAAFKTSGKMSAGFTAPDIYTVTPAGPSEEDIKRLEASKTSP